jgi:hypothetical protein
MDGYHFAETLPLEWQGIRRLTASWTSTVGPGTERCSNDGARVYAPGVPVLTGGAPGDGVPPDPVRRTRWAGVHGRLRMFLSPRLRARRPENVMEGRQ